MSRKLLAIGSLFENIYLMTWIWEHKNWPNFTWKQENLNPICKEVIFQIGNLSGKVGVVEKNDSIMNELDSLLKNIITSSAIEGESLNVFSVRSSLAKRLKIKIDKYPTSPKTEGLAELQFDILKNTDKKISLKRLFQWHRWLFPEPTTDFKIPIGRFRGNTPMQVVSGRINNPKVHFEAPPRNQLKYEMKYLIDWFEKTKTVTKLDPLVRAGIIHLWFVTIHPFEDGNGRLARIISELALAQYENKSIKLYSLSSTMMDKRKEYYAILEQTQKGGLDITLWLVWFLNTLKQSIKESLDRIDKVLYKSQFWRIYRELDFLPEQKKVLNIMLNSETSQFNEGISANQYQKIAKVSKATATRHLTGLAIQGCLKKISAGRSTKYIIQKSKS